MLAKYLFCLLFFTFSSTNLITYLTNVEGFAIHINGSLPPVSVGKLLSTSDIQNKNPSNQTDSYMPCTAVAHTPKYLTDVERFAIHTTGSLPPVSIGKLLSTWWSGPLLCMACMSQPYFYFKF